MELTHDFVVPAPIESAWATFMDLEQVGSCFPGASVESVTEDGFTGTVKVKLGPIALVYSGTGKFIERDDAGHHAVIEAKGKDKRGNGTAGATVSIRLAPAEGGAHTRVDVATDLAITGKPAQFGRGVMQDVSDKLLQQFVGCIESRRPRNSRTECRCRSIAPRPPTTRGWPCLRRRSPRARAATRSPRTVRRPSSGGRRQRQAHPSPPGPTRRPPRGRGCALAPLPPRAPMMRLTSARPCCR